jgi:hypothetical protein
MTTHETIIAWLIAGIITVPAAIALLIEIENNLLNNINLN